MKKRRRKRRKTTMKTMSSGEGSSRREMTRLQSPSCYPLSQREGSKEMGTRTVPREG